MIVTICGAYRNAGDHLIGDRARTLLRTFVDPEIVNVDRRSIGPDHYSLFNKARAVILTGGPAYQREIYPKIYPFDYRRIAAPIVPYGLGWKSKAEMSPCDFRFAPVAAEFVKDIHAKIDVSSARDPLTVEVLSQAGVDNVLMTGCPAWYDLGVFEKPYLFNSEIKNLVLSMPAIIQPGTFDLMVWLAKRFPKARRTLSFHHGLIPSTNPRGRKSALQFTAFSAASMMRGWRVASLAGSLPKLEKLYGEADLHIGYRVHAHLFCLSRRVPSILINEDSRGVGQAAALGTKSLGINGGDLSPIQEAIEAHFESRGSEVSQSIATMRDTFPTMHRFLKTLV